MVMINIAVAFGLIAFGASVGVVLIALLSANKGEEFRAETIESYISDLKEKADKKVEEYEEM